MLSKENAKYPMALRRIANDELEGCNIPPGQIEVWRSRDFLVQIFDQSGVQRMSVCSTKLKGHDWKDRVMWDDLQRLKDECGRGDITAVEIFPPNADVVNVANMRHLFFLPDPPSFMWRSKPVPNATRENGDE